MSPNELDLAPGVRRLRPDDHFMILAETDSSPMHVGALVLLETGGAGDVAARLRAHVGARLPGTPLQTRLVQSPDGYDSDVWVDVAAIDLDHHVAPVAGGPWTLDALRTDVAARSMARLDLGHSPFQAFVYETVEGGMAAFYLKVHHAIADGIGFQTLLKRLSDATPPPPAARDGATPSPEAWRALADARFAALEPVAAAHAARRREALGALDRLKADPATMRTRTPVLKMSGATSPARAYATASLALARLKAVGEALGGTVNDVFLALCASAIRATLIALDDLPDTPIVVNSARSYRRPEHGAFGNRINAQHPHLATHLADPLARFHAIRAEMAREHARAPLDEAMLDQPERPYGARDRRARFAERMEGGKALLPGNVTLSNVPGPAEPLGFAGFLQRANYPVPIIGSGRFLNITSRRNAAMLDMGVMTDATRVPDPGRLARDLASALDVYEALATR